MDNTVDNPLSRIPVNIEDEMKRSYLDYAMSVIIGRALPDVRDGLKPAYDTLVRLAQNFNMRYTLVDGQGNFGSIDGDPPAAYRYTEARLDSLAEEMMADLDQDTVDFAPNYDETTEEPTVLPT